MYAVAPRAWRRHLGLMLDAFRAEHAHALPERQLKPHQVQEAMMALADPGRGDRRLLSMPSPCPRAERAPAPAPHGAHGANSPGTKPTFRTGSGCGDYPPQSRSHHENRKHARVRLG